MKPRHLQTNQELLNDEVLRSFTNDELIERYKQNQKAGRILEVFAAAMMIFVVIAAMAGISAGYHLRDNSLDLREDSIARMGAYICENTHNETFVMAYHHSNIKDMVRVECEHSNMILKG